jgi:hypothetical protein
MFGFSTFGDSAGQLDTDFDRPKTWEDYSRVVESGLPDDEREALRAAYENLRYANGHFDDLDQAHGRGPSAASPVFRQDSFNEMGPQNGSSDPKYQKPDFRCGQAVAQRVFGELSKNLYKPPPTRQLADRQVSDVVEAIYRANGASALWPEADRLSGVGGYSAFQYAGVEDPKSPVRIHLWSRDQCTVWTHPQDHRKPEAVFTTDRVDGRVRGSLWTEEKHVTYTTRRGNTVADQTRRFEVVSVDDNPYRDPDGRGIIPFSFAHWRYPATEFTDDSPGNRVTELNKYINFGFDDLADGVRYIVKPIGLAEGVDEAWSAPAIVKPGMFLNLAAGKIDAGGNGPTPTLRYLNPDVAFVQTTWNHLNNYLDLSLEMENIPPSTIRMVLGDRSGVSILSEAAPLLGWTEQRRRPFAHYEAQAVSKCLEVLAAHLRNHGRDARRFDEAALNPGLRLRWPRLYVDLPGPERDRQDGVRITWGYASLIDIVMEREDCDRDQAVETLKRVKSDNDELQALGIEPVPAVLLPKPGGFGADQGGGGGGAPSFNESMDQLASNGVGDEGAPVSGMNADPNARADSLSGEGG